MKNKRLFEIANKVSKLLKDVHSFEKSSSTQKNIKIERIKCRVANNDLYIDLSNHIAKSIKNLVVDGSKLNSAILPVVKELFISDSESDLKLKENINKFIETHEKNKSDTKKIDELHKKREELDSFDKDIIKGINKVYKSNSKLNSLKKDLFKLQYDKSNEEESNNSLSEEEKEKIDKKIESTKLEIDNTQNLLENDLNDLESKHKYFKELKKLRESKDYVRELNEFIKYEAEHPLYKENKKVLNEKNNEINSLIDSFKSKFKLDYNKVRSDFDKAYPEKDISKKSPEASDLQLKYTELNKNYNKKIDDLESQARSLKEDTLDEKDVKNKVKNKVKIKSINDDISYLKGKLFDFNSLESYMNDIYSLENKLEEKLDMSNLGAFAVNKLHKEKLNELENSPTLKKEKNILNKMFKLKKEYELKNKEVNDLHNETKDHYSRGEKEIIHNISKLYPKQIKSRSDIEKALEKNEKILEDYDKAELAVGSKNRIISLKQKEISEIKDKIKGSETSEYPEQLKKYYQNKLNDLEKDIAKIKKEDSGLHEEVLSSNKDKINEIRSFVYLLRDALSNISKHDDHKNKMEKEVYHLKESLNDNDLFDIHKKRLSKGFFGGLHLKKEMPKVAEEIYEAVLKGTIVPAEKSLNLIKKELSKLERESLSKQEIIDSISKGKGDFEQKKEKKIELDKELKDLSKNISSHKNELRELEEATKEDKENLYHKIIVSIKSFGKK